MIRKLLISFFALVLAAVLWGGYALYKRGASKQSTLVPTTRVKRGNVSFLVAASGELLGGNSEMLAAPMAGGRDMVITYLRESGEIVNAGDVVAQIDTTEQEFNLREAEADVAEADQQVIQAQAESGAREEETRYELLQARAQVELAALDVRRNPLVAAITARQNSLALEAARDRLRQLDQDIKNRKATTEAGVAIQEAVRGKARIRVDTAKKTIESLTLRAKTKGYVALQRNTATNIMYMGMELPIFQVGDTVHAGMAIAQIPDLSSWEVSARIGELDRGHLAPGQSVATEVAALPFRKYLGKVTDIGGTSGPPWDRRFECKVSIDDPSPELRPGMSARIVITTGVLSNVLWVPSQALFESDGRTFVYVRSASTFIPADVKLVRRSESQVVLTGLRDGQVVALASPERQAGKKGGANVLKAIPKS